MLDENELELLSMDKSKYYHTSVAKILYLTNGRNLDCSKCVVW